MSSLTVSSNCFQCQTKYNKTNTYKQMYVYVLLYPHFSLDRNNLSYTISNFGVNYNLDLK